MGVHYFMFYWIFISIFVKMCLGSRGGPGGPIHPLCASVHFCEQELDWELWSDVNFVPKMSALTFLKCSSMFCNCKEYVEYH